MAVEYLEAPPGRISGIPVDDGLYGSPDKPAPTAAVVGQPEPQPGTVRKQDGRLVLVTEDGRTLPLTQYFCG